MRRSEKIFPCLVWLKTYQRTQFSNDLIAAVIVTIMLIPQSLAYALLAGVPPQVGLYASILPLMLYAVFGTSRTLSVGPVAVASLMTAAAIQNLGIENDIDYLNAAIMLAFLSGLFLILLGFLKLGFLANFLSHPVVSGFITASGIIIGLSQLRHMLGIQAGGDNLIELVASLALNIESVNTTTMLLGIAALVFLFWSRMGLKGFLIYFSAPQQVVKLLPKVAPVFVVILTSLVAYHFNLEMSGLALVGEIPSGLPTPAMPAFSNGNWVDFVLPAMLISIIGYVESVSVGRTLAAKRRQKTDSNQELIGLGSANIASAFSGGFPVTGGFSRSVVNFDSGAETPLAGFMTALGIALAAMTLTGLLAYLPKATLAATIIVAVSNLIDFSILKKTWNYSRSDFIAVLLTIVITLLAGVEVGVSSGIIISIFLHLYKTSKPHIAEVGQIAGTEHFRNVNRHKVITHSGILTLRIDESLYFPNASYLEDQILQRVAEQKELKHIVLMCTAINEIDVSALEILESINHFLDDLGVCFHLSEVKGPVMDKLKKTDFLEGLSGQVFLSQHQAIEELLKMQYDEAKRAPGFNDFQI
ncbi:MAG: sodium-independent anion transporter [SAR86 cluster bacterium]|uniref:Sodium-independent anion transporter n=1 Tax=SAR86 cluster bacterium TaxID=2030880 RepID=A0A2A5CH04_9GAMM|nr:sulfate permease [Gammaproteobacteria bacterium AH-315-E17]PCJ42666.1 MAG: sodium-independent anion transporter [SAR86 cluster bacterium]